MPLGHAIQDMPELYYAAVRALEYGEPSSEHSPDNSARASRDASRTFSPGKQFEKHGSFSNWLHSWFSYLVGSPERRQTLKRSDDAF